MLELNEKFRVFFSVAGFDQLDLVPPLQLSSISPRPDDLWQPFDPASNILISSPATAAIASILLARAQGNANDFNLELISYHQLLDQQLPGGTTRLNFEAFFNRVDPFIVCMYLYVVAFLLAASSWAIFRVPLRACALTVLLITLLVHTAAILARMYIQSRPPVTNLYSSAIFIAWAAVVLAVALEFLWRNGIGIVVAALVAFPSLLIAHYLAVDGDTMRPLQAVLDTNLWLSTHVVCVTTGYASTFLAGILGIVYVIKKLVQGPDELPEDRILVRMTYGIICFAMFFSFVGTRSLAASGPTSRGAVSGAGTPRKTEPCSSYCGTP